MSNPSASQEPVSHEIDDHSDWLSDGRPGIDVKELLRVWRIHRKLILGTAIAVFVLTLIGLLQFTPLYTATAVVMLNEQKNNIEDINTVLAAMPTDQASIQNQLQILTSRGLASRVISSLHLESDPEFNSAIKPEWIVLLSRMTPATWFGAGVSTESEAQKEAAAHDALVDKFLKRLSVEPKGLSTAISVEFDSQDPQKAQRITNAVSDAYVEDQLNAKFEASQKATKWLSDRIEQLADQVQSADAAVQQYKAANNLNEAVEGTSLVDQQLGTLNSQLIAARADLAQKQAIYGHVAGLQRSGHSADVSQVVQSLLISQLRGQETDLIRQEADLKSKYGPNHPKMLDLESQLVNVKQKIGEEVGHVVQTVANDAAISAAQVRSLETSLGRLEGEATVQNKARVQLTALTSKATSTRSMYEAFISRLKGTQGQEDIQAPDARVLSVAAVPSSPSFPNKPLILGAALPGGLVLGLLLAFFAERLDSGFRTTTQVEGVLRLPVLATVPELGRSKSATAAVDRIIDKPMSHFAEALRGLQFGLTLSRIDDQPRVVVVTSAVPGEGKTTIAVSLARQAALSGKKVLLIDCDLRNPTIPQTVMVLKPDVGILDALAGKVPVENCLIKDPRTTVMILPCAQKPINPMDVLASTSMKRLVEKLKPYFDLIVIDSAPILPVHDTKMLSQVADTFLFVIRWEKTPRDAVASAIRSLIDANAHVAGTALTRANFDRFQYYSHGYQDREGYGKYYNE